MRFGDLPVTNQFRGSIIGRRLMVSWGGEDPCKDKGFWEEGKLRAPPYGNLKTGLVQNGLGHLGKFST